MLHKTGKKGRGKKPNYTMNLYISDSGNGLTLEKFGKELKLTYEEIRFLLDELTKNHGFLIKEELLNN